MKNDFTQTQYIYIYLHCIYQYIIYNIIQECMSESVIHLPDGSVEGSVTINTLLVADNYLKYLSLDRVVTLMYRRLLCYQF